MITFKLNGKDVQGEEGQYILRVAEKYGIEIPTLCHHKALDPAGMCRLCTVELYDGRRTRFVTACNYPIWEGMEIETAQYDLKEPRFRIKDDTCILCGLCTRICDKIGNSAIGLTGRGVEMKVDTPFHVQTKACLACGACVSVCPTGHIKLEDITRHAVKPIPSEYDMGLANRKPIYVPYAQAIPNTPVIDRTRCVHFKTDGCKICVSNLMSDRSSCQPDLNRLIPPALTPTSTVNSPMLLPAWNSKDSCLQGGPLADMCSVRLT
jgi:heterodisulfide reductase subunit A